jgi:hypothetical protein
MARKSAEERGVIPRVVKFEIFPTPEQAQVLSKVNENLLEVWNTGHAERQEVFDAHFAPLYEELKALGIKARAGEDVSEEEKEVKARLRKATKDNRIITDFDQINALTAKREADNEFANFPRNWQEQTLIVLYGGLKSFMKLRKQRDLDAKPPRARVPGFIYEIYGRSGFRVDSTDEVAEYRKGRNKGRKVRIKEIKLSCKKVAGGVNLVFPLPRYQSDILCKAEESGKFALKQFTLRRDERDRAKPGRYWISIAYEYARPDQVKDSVDRLVFVSLSASYVGIVSPKGEEVVELWRPDIHWKPKIDAVIDRMKNCKENSAKWRKRNKAKRIMQVIMAQQQKQNQREVPVKAILPHGVHIVVQDIVVRSKAGKLADSSKKERGGSPLGLNWGAQNTGSFARLVAQLDEKVKERGGSLRRHSIPIEEPDPLAVEDVQKRMALSSARTLRKSYLQSLEVGIV